MRIKKNDEGKGGCIRDIICVRKGSKQIAYERIEELPSAAKLLDVALKLENIKIRFDELAEKTEAMALYYQKEEDSFNSERFFKVSGMFESAKTDIDDLRAKLRKKAKISLISGLANRILILRNI